MSPELASRRLAARSISLELMSLDVHTAGKFSLLGFRLKGITVGSSERFDGELWESCLKGFCFVLLVMHLGKCL